MRYGLLLFVIAISIAVTSQSYSQNLNNLLVSTLEEEESKELVDKLCNIGDSIACWVHQGNPIDFATHALEIAKRRNYKEQLGRAYFTIGRIKFNAQFDAESADLYYDSALMFLHDTKENTIYRTIYGWSQLEKAFLLEKRIGLGGIKKQYFEAIKILETGDQLGKWIAKEQKIQLLEWDGDHEGAFQKFKELLDEYRKDGNIKRQLFALQRVVFESIRRDTAGLGARLDEMEKISNKYNLKYFLADVHFNRGRWLYKKHDFKGCLRNLHLAEEEYGVTNASMTTRAYVATFIAFSYENMGNLKMARMYWHSAVSLAKDGVHGLPVYWVISQASDFFKRNNMLDSALFYKDQHIKLIEKQLAERDLHINELEELYLAKQALAENKKLESDLKYEKIVARSLISAGVLLMLIVIIVVKSRQRVKNANKQLNQKNEELHTKHEEISRQNEAIELQHRQLLSLDAMKSRLLSIVAHDVRGPLNTILSLHTLRQFSNDNELKRLDEMISHSVNATINLLNNIVQWGASQVSGQKAVLKQINLHHLVNDVFNSFSSAAQQKKIGLENRVENHLEVTTDPDIVHLVLRNLINNAVKFSPNGTISVGVQSSGAEFTITVADEGIGITEEKLQTLFNPTKIQKSEGTNKEKGSGFGLILCQEYITKLNGRIFCKRNDYKGTTFFIAIPKVELEKN